MCIAGSAEPIPAAALRGDPAADLAAAIAVEATAAEVAEAVATAAGSSEPQVLATLLILPSARRGSGPPGSFFVRLFIADNIYYVHFCEAPVRSRH